MLLLTIFILCAVLYTVLFGIFVTSNWWILVLLFIGFIIVNVLLFLLVNYIIAILNSKKNEINNPKKILNFITSMTCRFLIVFYNVKIVVQNKELLKDRKSFLLVTNHQSILDPIFIIPAYGFDNLTYIMKKEIMNIPIIGRWLYACGFLPLDRSNNRKGMETIIHGIKRINDGFPIGVFPEGTRSKNTNIAELKDGTFKIPLRAKCPIVVTILDDMYKIKKRFPFRRTKVTMRVCRVLEYDDFKDMKTHEISAYIRSIMVENLEKLRKSK